MTTKTLKARWIVLIVIGGLVLTACGRAAPNGSGPGGNTAVGSRGPDGSIVNTPPGESDPGPDLEAPPPVTVRFFDDSFDLRAWTYCYRNACVDGAPPSHPADVGAPGEVIVEFPLPDWSFGASFQAAGDNCGRIQDVPLERIDEGRFVLRPAGYAGTYDVTLTGRGEGDLFTTFRWTTPTDGPLPEPTARLAVLADHDGGIDSYGVELDLTNLASTPKRASATITVRAANGNEIAFEATRARGECNEGSIYWGGPDSKGLAAARLGESPFTYKVELTLDGVRYVADATWPEDEIAGNEPSVRLEFTPDLPALS